MVKAAKCPEGGWRKVEPKWGDLSWHERLAVVEKHNGVQPTSSPQVKPPVQAPVQKIEVKKAPDAPKEKPKDIYMSQKLPKPDAKPQKTLMPVAKAKPGQALNVN